LHLMEEKKEEKKYADDRAGAGSGIGVRKGGKPAGRNTQKWREQTLTCQPGGRERRKGNLIPTRK